MSEINQLELLQKDPTLSNAMNAFSTIIKAHRCLYISSVYHTMNKPKESHALVKRSLEYYEASQLLLDSLSQEDEQVNWVLLESQRLHSLVQIENVRQSAFLYLDEFKRKENMMKGMNKLSIERSSKV